MTTANRKSAAPLARMFRWWQSIPLQHKFIVLLIVMIVLAQLDLSLNVIPALRNAAEQSVVGILQTELDNKQEFVDQTFLQVENALSKLANHSTVETYLLNPKSSDASIRKAAEETLTQGLSSFSSRFLKLQLIDLGGQQLALVEIFQDDQVPAVVDQSKLGNISENPIFNRIQSIRENALYVQETLVGPSSIENNELVGALELALPILINGDVQGYLIADVRLTELFGEELAPSANAPFEMMTGLYRANTAMLTMRRSGNSVLVTSIENLSENDSLQIGDLNPTTTTALQNYRGQEFVARPLVFERLPLPIYNASWQLVVMKSTTDPFRQAVDTTLNRIRLGRLLLAFLLIIFIYLVILGFSSTLKRLSLAATQLAQGDTQIDVPLSDQGEMGVLSRGLVTIAMRLNLQKSDVESQEGTLRQRELKIVAEIGRDTVQSHNIDELLQRTVNAIRERFNFYHVQVFLLDDIEENAVLVTSTGEMGKQLLARNHKLAVGSNSIVGQTTAKGRPFITLDTRSSEVAHRFNPLLPNTRSEMAIPLRIRNRVIGALDIQSVEPDAFSEDNVQIFEVLADQLAIAVQNARLFAESEKRFTQIEELNKRLTASAWQEYGKTRRENILHAEYNLMDVQHDEYDQSSILASSGNTQARQTDIVVRGTKIGTLDIQERHNKPLSDDEQQLVKSIVERVGTAIENARLVERTQASYAEVERLYLATRNLSFAHALDEIYSLTAAQLDSYEFIDQLLILRTGPQADFAATHLQVLINNIKDTTRGQTLQIGQQILRNQLPVTWLALPTNQKRSLKFSAEKDEFTRRLLEQTFMAPTMRSGVVAALASSTYWFGYVVCLSKRQDVFNESFVRYLVALTDQATQAIENRYLFDEAEAESRRNRALAEAVQVTSRIGLGFEAGVIDLFQTMSLTARYDRWWFGYLDPTPNGQVLRRLVAQGEPNTYLSTTQEISIERDRNTLTETVHTYQALLVNNPVNHFAVPSVLAKDLGKHITAPVIIGSDLIGALLIGRSIDSVDLTDKDLQLVTTLASQISVAWENRRLFNTAESERQTLQVVLDSLPTGVLVVNRQGSTILSNEQASRLFSGDNATSKLTILDQAGNALAPDDFAPNQVLRTRSPLLSQDLTIIDEDDNRTELVVNAVPIFDQAGAVSSAVAVFQDVTELRDLQHILEENLRETSTLYQTTRLIAAETDIVGVLRVLAEQVDSVMTPDTIQTILADSTGKPNQIFTAEKWENGFILLPIDSETLRLPSTWLADESVFIEDTTQEHDERITAEKPFELDEKLISSVAIYPFKVRGNLIGWLVVGYEEQHVLTLEENRILSTMSDQAAIAIETTRLARQTQDALNETTLLYDAVSQINRATTLEDTLLEIRDRLRYFAPSYIDILLSNVNTEAGSYRHVMTWIGSESDTTGKINLDVPLVADTADLLNYPAYFHNNIYVEDQLYDELSSQFPHWKNIVSQASVPMISKGQLAGRIIVSFSRPYKFGRLEQQFMTTIADQAVIIMDNITLVKQTQDTLDETSMLYDTARYITDAYDIDAAVNAIIDHAAPYNLENMWIFQMIGESWTSDNSALRVLTTWNVQDPTIEVTRQYTPDQMPIWDQITQPEQLQWVENVADADLSPQAREFFERNNIKSYVVMPLWASATQLGAAMMGMYEPTVISLRNERIYRSLADQLAISIQNRLLIEQMQRRARQLQTSAIVSKSATSILNLDELFNQTVNMIKDNFSYDHVQIFLVDASSNMARLVSSTGEAGRSLLEIKHALAVGSQSVIGNVTQSGQPSIVLDTQDIRYVHRPNPYLPLTRSEMALPLIARNRILGALDVQSNRPGTFTAEDVSVLATLADQIAVAIDNARLFETSNRRVEEMQFLFNATNLAIAINEEAEVALIKIAESVQENLRAAAAAVMLLSSQDQQLVTYSAHDTDTDIHFKGRYSTTISTFKTILAERQPFIFNDLVQISRQAMPGLAEIFPNTGSAIFVPLTVGSEFVGLIVALKAERQGFDEDALKLLQTLSSTLGAIIQNAQLVNELQSANTRLREIDKLKSQFLANMSHELRTPLNSIIGFSRVILKGIDGPLTDMQQQDLTTIHDSGRHLLGLVNDILDQAKIEAGKMDLTSEEFSIVEVIKGVASTAVGLLKDKPVQLHQEIETDLPQVWGDEFRTRQVLLNLVSNAAKFTSEGSITLSAFKMQENQRDMVQISVTDTGIGIPDDKVNSIFEAFQQVENSTARQYEGTGLGLPIARYLVEQQGGHIWVDSQPNIGSTFSFTIPIERPSTEKENQPAPTTSEQATVKAHVETSSASAVTATTSSPTSHLVTPRIILAIDDEISAINLYRRYIVSSGYQVVSARPDQAEEYAIVHHPCVILLDINMPNQSGWEVLKNLRNNDQTFRIPIIICTIDKEHREEAFRLGATDYLTKPVLENTLIQAIKMAEKNRYKILIVDDKPDSIRLVRDTLNADERLQILEALGGAQGLDMAAHHWFDLILVDLRMPEMDGLTFIEQLRNSSHTRDIPVLVLTADDISEEEQVRLQGIPIYQKATLNMDQLLEQVLLLMPKV